MSLPGIPAGTKILSIGELTRQVKGLIEEGFPSVWVAGEISNLRRSSPGHLYLTLKDSQAQIRAVIFRSVALRLRFDLRDGMQAIVRGRLTVYVVKGEYELQVEEVHLKGMGALELALRQLKEKLFRLGYFAPERKKRLPRFPRRVAIVTSPTGAAIRDMLEILGRRWPATEVWICPVRVQGDGAAEEITAAVSRLNQLPQIDVIIVGRGGGSLEDLWAFNAECLAHAIYRSRIPIVSAVGHEIDLTIADLVADCRALTPSEAAERVVPHCEELLESMRALEGQLRTLLLRRLELSKARLSDLAERRCFRLPLERVRDEEHRLNDWSERLERAARQRQVQMRERLEAQAARLETLSPLNVLGRGYSLTRREADNLVVRSPDQVRSGERLVTFVQHGQIVSRVEAPEQATGPSAS
jgi:exodeoxyribonuclease VII large subunit